MPMCFITIRMKKKDILLFQRKEVKSAKYKGVYGGEEKIKDVLPMYAN